MKIWLSYHSARHFPRDKALNQTKATGPLARMKSGLLKFFFLGIFCLISSCATPSSGPVRITKVNPYHLNSARLYQTDDEMIRFEQRHYLYGAVDGQDIKDRYGNYFTIFWATKTKQPVTVRLEYRQGSTASQIHALEVVVNKPKSRNETKFQITGDDYKKNGKVTQWKASIVDQGTVVAEYKSYLWQ